MGTAPTTGTGPDDRTAVGAAATNAAAGGADDGEGEGEGGGVTTMCGTWSPGWVRAYASAAADTSAR